MIAYDFCHGPFSIEYFIDWNYGFNHSSALAFGASPFKFRLIMMPEVAAIRVSNVQAISESVCVFLVCSKNNIGFY